MLFIDGEELEKAIIDAPIGMCVLDAETLVVQIVNPKFIDIVYIMMNLVTPFRGKLYTPLAAMYGSECYYSQAKYN